MPKSDVTTLRKLHESYLSYGQDAITYIRAKHGASENKIAIHGALLQIPIPVQLARWAYLWALITAG